MPTSRKVNAAKSNVVKFDRAKNATSDRARDIMLQEKLALQELSQEFYLLLLEEYKANISDDHASIFDLELLLEQQMKAKEPPKRTLLHHNKLEQFCYNYRLTIEQYCRLQQRILDFPASLKEWQKLNQDAKRFNKKCD